MKQLENQTLYELNRILIKLSTIPKMPLKMSIARNLRVMDPFVSEYTQKLTDLFQQHVLINDKGDAVFEDNYAAPSDSQSHPYTAFVYPEGNYEKMIEKMNELAKETVEVTFVEEDIERMIYVTVGEGMKEVPLRAILEDPESPITPQMIVLFSAYFLKV